MQCAADRRNSSSTQHCHHDEDEKPGRAADDREFAVGADGIGHDPAGEQEQDQAHPGTRQSRILMPGDYSRGLIFSSRFCADPRNARTVGPFRLPLSKNLARA